MSLWYFVVSRNWASSRLRLLLTIVGVALGVAIVVAIYVMDHNTIQSRLLSLDPQRGRVDLEVVPTTAAANSDAVAARLSGWEGVQAVATWREARAVVRSGGVQLDLAVYGLGPLPAGPFGHYAVVPGGRDLTPSDGDEASPGLLLGGEAARMLGVKPGDRVEVAEPALVQRVECRDGKLVPVPMPAGAQPFAASATVVGVLTSDRLGARNEGQVAVCGLGLARRLQPRGAEVFHVLRREGADLDRLGRELRAEFHVQDKRGALIGEGADERAFRNGLKVLGGLALLLGMYVVFQTLSHSLVARVRQLGLLRCLGAGTGAITRIFLCDALLLGVVGSAVGVVLGLLLALLLRDFHVSSLGLNKPWTTFDVPWYPVAWTAALGVLFTLAGAMFPLVRARQVPALDILRARGLAPGKDDGVDLLRGINLWMFALLVLALPVAYLAMTPLAAEEGRETLTVLLELVGMLGLFGSVLLLAPGAVAVLGRALLLPLRPLLPMQSWLVGKVVARSAGRVAAAVCGLSAVLLALLGLKSLTGSLEAEVDVFAAEALQGRLFLLAAPCTPERAAGLAKVPGVLAVEAYEGEQRGDGFFLRGLDVSVAGGADGPLAGRPDLVRQYEDPKVRSLVVSRRLAKHRGLVDGSVVTTTDKNGVPVAYRVLAVSDRCGFDMDERAWAITSPRWMHSDFCVPETSVEHLTLRIDDEERAPAIAAAARTILGTVMKVKTGDRDIHGYLHRDVGRDFVLFDLLLFLMLVLAGVGLLNGMTIAALGRARELGVLRALGMGRGGLGGSFLLEGALVAALASVLSLLLATPMAWVLVRGMNQVAALDAPLTLPWAWFWIVPAAALGTCVLASVVPAFRALRQSPSESVRYE